MVRRHDDGIQSPGIWAAAAQLQEIGEVRVIAPREQMTSAGRSHPTSSDGLISEFTRVINGAEVRGLAVGGSPAQVVHFAMHEILTRRPDLIVSGINYGSNTGMDITRSGTVGAALEGASYGVPAMAVSFETTAEMVYSHSADVDFSVAAFFTGMFAKQVLKKKLDHDVYILKVEVPSNATVETPWEVATLSPVSVYVPEFQKRRGRGVPAQLSWKMQSDTTVFPPGSDAYTVYVKRLVAVTPLSLDLTSRVNLEKFEKKLRLLDSK